MPSSVSGQDNQILRCDWLSCPLGTVRRAPQEKFPLKSYNKSFIDQVCSVKMARYWPRSFFASFWTSTPSRSKNTQKKSSANIRPSWPQNWSITQRKKRNITLCRDFWNVFSANSVGRWCFFGCLIVWWEVMAEIHWPLILKSFINTSGLIKALARWRQLRV